MEMGHREKKAQQVGDVAHVATDADQQGGDVQGGAEVGRALEGFTAMQLASNETQCGQSCGRGKVRQSLISTAGVVHGG